MKKHTFKTAFIALATGLLMWSCSSDDNSLPDEPILTDELPKNETWVVFNANADWSGGIYALKDNKSRSMNLSGIPFYQVSYSAGGRVVDNTLYKLNGASSTDIGISKYAIDKQGKVNAAGFLATPNNTYETNTLIVSNTEGYYWDLSAGGLKIQVFNPSTMQRTGEIDFSSLTKGRPYEAAGQLILAKNDDRLFVDLQFGTRTASWQVVPDEEKVQIAVYNLKEKKIENVTTYDKASHLGLFADHVLWSIDEVTKSLYVIAVGEMKQQKPASKILRIKAGQTSFDTTFELDIKDYQFPSDFNRILAYNDKIYTTISDRPTSYYGGGQHGVSYRKDIWYWNEIDIKTKRAKRLNLPVDNFYSYQNPFFHNGEIYFLSNNATDNYAGVNQYDPKTGKIKETIRLKESGRLMGFHIITP